MALPLKSKLDFSKVQNENRNNLNQKQPNQLLKRHSKNQTRNHNFKNQQLLSKTLDSCDFNTSISLLFQHVWQLVANMKPFLCQECLQQTSQIIKNVKEAINHAHSILTSQSQITSINKSSLFQSESNNISEDENIALTNRGRKSSLQNYVDVARRANPDLNVKKASNYFSGSNFKSRKSSMHQNIDQCGEANYETNKENVRMSTIAEEINKPSQRIFNNSSNNINLSEIDHFAYFQVTVEQQNEFTKSNEQIDFRSIEKSSNGKAQKILRQISSERPISYRYDNKANSKHRQAISYYLDEDSTDSMKLSDCSNQNQENVVFQDSEYKFQIAKDNKHFTPINLHQSRIPPLNVRKFRVNSDYQSQEERYKKS